MLVAIQFILLGLLLFSTPLRLFKILPLVLITMSLLLVLWAVMAMQKSRLRISPVPAADSKLVSNGPYKFLRHPMYTSIIMGAAGLLTMHFSWPRLFFAVALLLLLLIKLHWEEDLLSNKFKDYKDYKRGTKKIIPFLY